MPSRFILTPSYNGISQELSVGDVGECSYMQDIGIEDMKCEQLEKTFILTGTGNLGVTDSINYMVETPQGVISCGQTRVFVGGGDKSGVVAGSSRVEYTTASGVQVNYFFNSTNILQTDADVTTITNTRSHAGGLVTASCLVYNKIIFSIGSILYQYDLSAIATAPTSLETDIPIISGLTVKNLYFYNDMLVISATRGSDTYTYMAQFTASGWEIYSTEYKSGFPCYGAIGDGGIVAWLSADIITGESIIFYFSGGLSTEMRRLGCNDSLGVASFGGTPELAFFGGNLFIASGQSIYKFGKKNNSRRYALTVRTAPRTVLAITGNYIHTQTTTNYIYTNSSKYPNSGYSITIPYDAGVYGDEKSNLAFQVGYRLRTGTSIEIGVMTDGMEVDNTANYVTVATITDTTKRRQTITVGEINLALATAGKSSDWQSIRFKRTLIAGEGTSGLRDNTPKLYDIKCIHNDINDGLE